MDVSSLALPGEDFYNYQLYRHYSDRRMSIMTQRKRSGEN
jgi:hypothetical protein